MRKTGSGIVTVLQAAAGLLRALTRRYDAPRFQTPTLPQSVRRVKDEDLSRVLQRLRDAQVLPFLLGSMQDRADAHGVFLLAQLNTNLLDEKQMGLLQRRQGARQELLLMIELWQELAKGTPPVPPRRDAVARAPESE